MGICDGNMEMRLVEVWRFRGMCLCGFDGLCDVHNSVSKQIPHGELESIFDANIIGDVG